MEKTLKELILSDEQLKKNFMKYYLGLYALQKAYNKSLTPWDASKEPYFYEHCYSDNDRAELVSSGLRLLGMDENPDNHKLLVDCFKNMSLLNIRIYSIKLGE